MQTEFRLQQTQFTGAGYSFGAPLNLQLAKDIPIVPFNRTQGEEKPLANLTIRESLGNKFSTSNSRSLNGSIRGLAGGRSDMSSPLHVPLLQIQPAAYLYSPALIPCVLLRTKANHRIPSSTKIRMKPPGSASVSTSPSSSTALSFSPCAWRATARKTNTLSRSSSQPFASA